MKIYMKASSTLYGKKDEKTGKAKSKSYEANTVIDIPEAVAKQLIKDKVAITYSEYEKIVKKQGLTTKDVNPAAEKARQAKQDAEEERKAAKKEAAEKAAKEKEDAKKKEADKKGK